MRRFGWVLLALLACACGQRARVGLHRRATPLPRAPKVEPPRQSFSECVERTRRSEDEPGPPSGAAPWSIVLESCANVGIASTQNATVVVNGFGVALVEGEKLTPLPVARPKDDLESIRVDDVVGQWPDRAWLSYSVSRGEDDNGVGRVAPIGRDTFGPDIATNVVAAFSLPSATGPLVLEGDSARSTLIARTVAASAPAPIRWPEEVVNMLQSGAGIGRLRAATVMSDGTMLIASDRELAVHRSAPGKAATVDTLSKTSRGLKAVDFLSFVTRSGRRDVHAAFNVHWELDPSDPCRDSLVEPKGFLTRFDGSAWTTLTPPDEGALEAFDVGADGALWAAAEGKLLRRDPPESAPWQVQPIRGHVVRVWAGHGSPIWAITKGGVLWQLEARGAWSATPLPRGSENKPLFARRVFVRESGEAWLSASTYEADPEWPLVETPADTLLRIGTLKPTIECARFSPGKFFTRRALRSASDGPCTAITFVPSGAFAGWMRPDDEAVIRKALTRIAPKAKVERRENGAITAVLRSEADALRVTREPVSSFAGRRPVPESDCGSGRPSTPSKKQRLDLHDPDLER